MPHSAVRRNKEERPRVCGVTKGRRGRRRKRGGRGGELEEGGNGREIRHHDRAKDSEGAGERKRKRRTLRRNCYNIYIYHILFCISSFYYTPYPAPPISYQITSKSGPKQQRKPMYEMHWSSHLSKDLKFCFKTSPHIREYETTYWVHTHIWFKEHVHGPVQYVSPRLHCHTNIPHYSMLVTTSRKATRTLVCYCTANERDKKKTGKHANVKQCKLDYKV